MRLIGDDAGAKTPSARTPTPRLSITPDTTWLEIKNMQILEEEERKFFGIKTELRAHIDKMRDKLHQLMAENDVRAQWSITAKNTD